MSNNIKETLKQQYGNIVYNKKRMIASDCESFLYKLNNSLYSDDRTYFKVEARYTEDNSGCYVSKLDHYSYNNRVIKIILNIDILDAHELAHQINKDINTTIRLIISHELLHLFLKHLDDKYDKLNRKLFNIAADLEVNSYINAPFPLLRAEQYNLPDFLTASRYYELLLEQAQQQQKKRFSFNNNNEKDNDKDENDNDNENNSNEVENECNDNNSSHSSNNNTDIQDEVNDESQNENNELINKFLESQLPKNEDDLYNHIEEFTLNNKDNHDTFNNIVKQYIDNNNSKVNIIEKIVHELNKYIDKKLNIMNLDNIISKLVSRENTKTIQPHDRVNTFTKLNNRRKQSGIILPGKKLVKHGLKKKFDSELTVFIDVSGSTSDKIHQLNEAAYRLYKVGATVVFYDDNIVSVIKPNEVFYCHNSRGGTSIQKVIKEYTNKYKQLHRAYIFTDGEDDFTNLNEVIKEYKVFYINKEAAVEIYSDKDVATSTNSRYKINEVLSKFMGS